MSELPNILVSHAYAGGADGVIEKFLHEVNALGGLVLMDSGAFSAFTLGKEIKMDDYCARLDRLMPSLWQYVALDVVQDNEASLVNLDEMHRRGYNPMAVFTTDAPFSELPTLLAKNDHLCVAGGVSQETAWYAARIERVWRESGETARIHGLGYTRGAAPLRSRVNSIDSSTWAVGSRYGNASVYVQDTGALRQINWRQYVEGRPLNKIAKPLLNLLLRSAVTPKDLRTANTGGERSLVSLLTYYAWKQYADEAERRGIKLFFAGANPVNFVQLIIVWRAVRDAAFHYPTARALQAKAQPHLDAKNYAEAVKCVLAEST